MKKLIIAVFIIFGSISAFGAPSITSVTGSVSEDSSVTISGADFGTNPLTQEWTKDHIDSGTTGNNFSKTNWFVAGVQGGIPQYSETRSHTGKSVVATYDNNIATSYGSAFSYNPPGTLSNVYYSYWIYVQLGTGTNTNNQWKGVRISENTAGNIGDEGWRTITRYNSSTGAGFHEQQVGCEVENVSEKGDAASFYISSDDFLDDGVWVRMEEYAEYASGVDQYDGYYYRRRIGNSENVLMFEANNVRTQGSTSPPWESVMFGTYCDLTGAIDSPTLIYFDDIYIAHTQARVEIGNASTWEACTLREIQNPTAWSTSSITVTVNQGTFGAGTVYLYIIDSGGSVNSGGYPITMGDVAQTSAAVLSGPGSAILSGGSAATLQ